jgi:hypothetical protein
MISWCILDDFEDSFLYKLIENQDPCLLSVHIVSIIKQEQVFALW